MSKTFIRKLLDKFNKKINEIDACGRKWIGLDGVMNMETAALITIVFMIFFTPLISILLSFLIALAKFFLDKSRGHTDEKHDLICACIGIIFGCILGIAL